MGQIWRRLTDCLESVPMSCLSLSFNYRKRVVEAEKRLDSIHTNMRMHAWFAVFSTIHSRILLTECASESLYSVQNIAIHRIRLIFDSSNTLVYRLGPSLDPHELNKCILREHFTLPILEDVLHELRDAKVFSKADLASGYWHVKLDEESSLLTTFQTCFGRYRYLRLPFGINGSSEYFQKKLVEALQGLPGVVCIADDVVIHGKDTEEHDRHVNLFLLRFREKGIKLNRAKLETKVESLTFMGHRVSKDGLSIDPSKVSSMREMEEPCSLEALRRTIWLSSCQISPY